MEFEVTRLVTEKMNIVKVQMDLAVRYDDEDVPFDFPLRKGDTLSLWVDMATGEIADWPKDQDMDLCMKVCDEGSYRLIDEKGIPIAIIESNYVPHGVVPGKYGDYVDFKIKGGIITNWPKNPDVSEFFKIEED